MTDTETLIARVYAAFNDRKIDAALALMTESISWPKASEGGRVVGKQEIRAYWTRQWQQFNPHVDPVEVFEETDGRARVRVHQLVKSLGGDLLSDSEVLHIYTFADGLIERMDLGEDSNSSGQGPSAAFMTRSGSHS